MLDKIKYKSLFLTLLMEQTCSLQFLLTVTLGQLSETQLLAVSFFLQSDSLHWFLQMTIKKQDGYLLLTWFYLWITRSSASSNAWKSIKQQESVSQNEKIKPRCLSHCFLNTSFSYWEWKVTLLFSYTIFHFLSGNFPKLLEHLDSQH